MGAELSCLRMVIESCCAKSFCDEYGSDTEKMPLGDVFKDPEGPDAKLLCVSSRFDNQILLTGPKPKIPDITFDKIVSICNIQNEVRQYIEFLKNPPDFLGPKISMTMGALLIGPNGSGKRTIARAIAGEANKSHKVGLFEVSDAIPYPETSSLEYKLVCNGENINVQCLFEIARSHAPCVVLIDNLDVINEICRPLIQHILHEMEKLKTNMGILFLGAVCKEPVGIEEKLLCRSNRFDNQIRLTEPIFQERKELFTLFLQDIKHDTTLDVDILARRTEGYEVGKIKRLLDQSMVRAITQNKKTITLEDVENLIEAAEDGAANKKFVSDKESLLCIARHEAGHALVSYYGDEQHFSPLYKITIIPRHDALGVTHTLPEGLDKGMTRRRLLSLIDVKFGGLVAEEILNGKESVTTGCHDDMKQATYLVERMVTEWSMSENIGFRVYPDELSGFSDDIKNKIEDEINSLLQKSYERVRSLSSGRQAELDLIAEALLKKKTLYGDDVKDLIEGSLSTKYKYKNKKADKSPNVVLRRTFSKRKLNP